SLSPHGAACQQAGKPFCMVSRLGLTTPFSSLGGGTTGPETTGCTAPPTTSPTVRTTVLRVSPRSSSQAANASSMLEGIDSESQLEVHTSWKVNCSHPPPCFSAPITIDLRSYSVQAESNWSRACVMAGRAGGTVSAQAQSLQPKRERMSPSSRPLL